MVSEEQRTINRSYVNCPLPNGFALTVAQHAGIARNSSISLLSTSLVPRNLPFFLSDHKFRHEKPFRCDFEGCSRSVKGFKTQTDLDGHRKTLHYICGFDGCPHTLKVFTTKEELDSHRRALHSDSPYVCAALNCARKDKVWRRADDFRYHCQDWHDDHDLHELMNRSEKLQE